MSVFTSIWWFAFWMLWSVVFGAVAAFEHRWSAVTFFVVMAFVWAFLLQRKARQS